MNHYDWKFLEEMKISRDLDLMGILLLADQRHLRERENWELADRLARHFAEDADEDPAPLKAPGDAVVRLQQECPVCRERRVSINHATGEWVCWGCHESGDRASYWSQHLRREGH